MGFLGLAPADNLAATYNPAEQILKLFARGEAPNFTYGFEFKRLTWLGGLKFELLAWSGPHASGARKFDHSQSFNIANLKVVDPDGSVTIVTSNHQNGQDVPVQWLSFEPVNTTLNPFRDSFPKSRNQSAMVGQPQTFDAEVVTINALFKEKFTIQESTHTSPSGSVQVQYSPFALTLQSAAIEFKNLVWTFNSLETGRTQIVVNISPGFGGTSIRKVYDINVIVLENSLIAGDALSGTAKGPLRAILDFTGRVKIALAIVQRTAPEAQLLVVEATLPRGVVYPVKDPLRLSQLECVFRTNSGTAIIRSTGWGEYGLPVFLPYVRLGVSVINLEGIKVDILPAVDAIRAAGFDLAFWSVTLNHPLVTPGQLQNEPYYSFHMVDGSYIFVGAKDGEVVVNHAGEKMLPSPITAGCGSCMSLAITTRGGI